VLREFWARLERLGVPFVPPRRFSVVSWFESQKQKHKKSAAANRRPASYFV